MKKIICVLFVILFFSPAFSQINFTSIHAGETYHWTLYHCSPTDTIVYYDDNTHSYDTIIGNDIPLSPTSNDYYIIISVNGMDYNSCYRELVIDVYPSYLTDIAATNTRCDTCHDGSISLRFSSEAQGGDYFIKVYDNSYHLIYSFGGTISFQNTQIVDNLPPGEYKVGIHQKIYGTDRFSYNEYTVTIE